MFESAHEHADRVSGPGTRSLTARAGLAKRILEHTRTEMKKAGQAIAAPPELDLRRTHPNCLQIVLGHPIGEHTLHQTRSSRQNMALKSYCLHAIDHYMSWNVSLHDEFEFAALPEDVQDELLARLKVLAEFGPLLGRPHVDTLKGSSFPNMKELRFRLNGVWRFAFAFDPGQQAIVLVGGDKEGASQSRFYARLIRTADARYSRHIRSLAARGTERRGK